MIHEVVQNSNNVKAVIPDRTRVGKNASMSSRAASKFVGFTHEMMLNRAVGY